MTPEFLIVDLFCGAGGVSTGFSQAVNGKQRIALAAKLVDMDKIRRAA